MSDRRDPFQSLAQPIEPQRPRADFARSLRARLLTELGLNPDPTTVPTLAQPRRTPMSTTPSPSPAPSNPSRAVATPYLTVRGGVDALAWYTQALGATEAFRVMDDDGRVGHAEFAIDGARIMLSDAYPDYGVRSPADLGGSAVTVHLEVTDVDTRFAQAIEAGATAINEPADQPHGSRHGTLVDPFGHRWMLSQVIEDVDLATYRDRSSGSGFTVEITGEPGPLAGEPGIWAGLYYRDALAGIRFLIDVLGFEEQTLHTEPDDPTVVVHCELRWPEGGVVQAGTYVADNPFVQAPGAQSIYVITRDPRAVWDRCQAAGVAVIRPPEEPHYHPGGLTFAIGDPEGNILSFGDYTGGA